MAYELEKFNSGTMDKGLSVRTMDFQGEIVLGIDSYNMTQGIQQGLGPRPGMATIPGQADAEAVIGSRFPGLRASEGTTVQGLDDRLKVLGIFPIKFFSPLNVSQKTATYAFVLTSTTQAGESIDISLVSIKNGSPQQEVISANIYDGFGTASGDIPLSSDGSNVFVEAIVPATDGTQSTSLHDFLLYSGSYFCSAVCVSITGPNIPTKWLFGATTSDGGATTAPSMNFFATSVPLAPGGGAAVVACGLPTEYNLANFTTSVRAIKMFALTNKGRLNIEYSASYTPTTTIMASTYTADSGTNLNLSGVTATKDTAGTTYTSSDLALVNDEQSSTNASYKAVLVASQKAYACIFQDGFRTVQGDSTLKGKYNQWFDLTQNTFQPRIFSSSYSEETVTTKTGFSYWPAFVRGTAMATGTLGVGLTAANTGILRANTVYEFTYAIYNKRLGFETNVATDVKFQTGDTDFVSLNLYTPSSAGFSAYADLQNASQTILNPFFSNFADVTGQSGYKSLINFIEYRFYYREEGTFEWLPALFMDASQFWFYTGFTKVSACTGSLAATVGGQPGGFNDYSPLAKDTYTCVLQYKDRVWWFSDRAINFSLQKNIFCYPARNSISALGGEFRGGIVHNYPGQAEQSSRLVIFGTKETYVARFTGVRQQTSVQVSPDAAGVFDIDASDLVIDPWTSITAFSYRSAVVAEGILYWWGPQGVWRDDGVSTPTRISGDIEPNLFTLYDPSLVSQIFGSYNNQTKEIEWFFTPKAAASDGEVNVSIIYNTISGNWTKGKYTQQVDWIQGLQIDTNIGTAGLREVIGSRLTAAATVQRAYFFDQRNRSGDIAPTKDFIVKQVSTPSTGVRRLTLAAGYDATNFASIVAGDWIALQQVTSYSGLAASDMIATVNAINTGSGTLDINLPTGATLATGSLTYDQYFPFWQSTATTRGLNGINYQMSTNYWLPNGVNGYYFWLYCYMLAKMGLWKSDLDLGWTFGYRTPTSLALATDEIPFADNSDGNFQVYHPLRPVNDNMEGQGLKFVLSGTHIGNEWVLQYMEAHGTPIPGDVLKRFEG